MLRRQLEIRAPTPADCYRCAHGLGPHGYIYQPVLLLLLRLLVVLVVVTVVCGWRGGCGGGVEGSRLV